MLEVKDLCAGYPGKEVLFDVNFTAPAGQVTAVIGPNGCGKSTLLKALCGILPLSGGERKLDGLSLADLPRRELAQKIAYLPQDRSVPEITAGRLVLHGRFPYLTYPRRYRPEDYAAAEAALEAMGIGEWAQTPLAQLSGGQRQKVYIAMALAQDTPVIALDEPTTYLDAAHQLQLLRHARDLAGAGKTVIMVIHDLSHAMITADRVVLLQHGRMMAEGTPEDVYGTGRVDEAFGLRLCRFQTGDGWQYYCTQP